ncbi:MAG: hypothetical protein HOP17_07740 [Acidobacteria bacterium]|nr:hypothetical protein [Acidobacteriota bacterium]
MKKLRLNFKKFNSFAIPLFFLILIHSVMPDQLLAQKRPTIFSQDPDSDDVKLCSTPSLATSEYCDLYKKYSLSEDTNKVLAAKYRDKMIESVAEQVDTYYDNVINKRRNNNKWFQTLFDILEIGAALAINITNGERAKSIIASALAGTQTGRVSVNKNFELLQTQILINQMNANRDEKLFEIINSKRLDIDQYSWRQAKRNLRDYLVRGTFNGALNNLVQQTGTQATTAKNKLANILQAPPQTAFNNSIKNFDGYIVPIQQKLIKTQADLAISVAGLVAAPADPTLLKQKADLTTQRDNLLANYKTITQEILNLGAFSTIDSQIRARFAGPANVLVVAAYDAFLAKFQITPNAVTGSEYDFFLTKVNVVASKDDSLNQAFLSILDKHKI